MQRIVNQPGDKYEQEADQFSKRVMEISAAPQAACACGGECPKCQQKTGEERSQTRRVLASETGQDAMLPVVHEVLRSPGRRLDSATRSFMERRFGYDFSQVRVHIDAQAAESARAVNALAYTAGNHIVFGAGQYLPGANQGRRLLAHELSHVVQQTNASKQVSPAGFGLSPVGNPVLQRKPDKADAEVKRERQLDDLAQDPGAARERWKSLTGWEQISIVERMRQRYGAAFAKQFSDEAKKGKPQLPRYYPPGEGPTAGQLTAGGYRFAGFINKTAVRVQVWVHPSGRTIQKDVTQRPSGGDELGKEPPNVDPPSEKSRTKEVKKKPPVVDPPVVTDDIRAQNLLADMHQKNSQLLHLCATDPFQSGDAEDAQNEWKSASKQLDALKLDVNAIQSGFWEDVAAARKENLEMRRRCCERDPSNYFFFCNELKSP